MKLTMKIKKIIYLFVPPFFYNLIRALNIFSKLICKPSWNEVTEGHLKGYFLYIPNRLPSFKAMLNGTYDKFFWDFISSINIDNASIIDIGGHIGYHAMNFAKLVGPEGKVITFEPNPFNVERMKLNLSKCPDLSKIIQIKNIPISNGTSKTQFHFSKNVDNQSSSGGYITESYPPLDSSVYKANHFISEEIETTTLDKELSNVILDNLKLIKIDVEGAEHLVIEGAMQTIKKNRPYLLIEVHSVSSMLYVGQLLHSLKYRIQLLEENRISRCFIAAIPI